MAKDTLEYRDNNNKGITEHFQPEAGKTRRQRSGIL